MKILGLSVVLGCMVLLASAAVADDAAEVGRYQIVVVNAAAGEGPGDDVRVLKIDTVTGVTWELARANPDPQRRDEFVDGWAKLAQDINEEIRKVMQPAAP